MTRIFGRMLAILALLLVPLVANAQDEDEAPGTLIMHGAITPKAGQVTQFMDAMKAHIDWRTDNRDPWEWSAYRMETGPAQSVLHYRSELIRWADIDAYETSDFYKQAQAHFGETVGPHVAGFDSWIDQVDMELSHWAEGPPANLVELYSFTLKHGKYYPWHQAASKMTAALKDANWRSFGWIQTYTGGRVNVVTLVVPHANWASFQLPDQSVRAIVTEAYGEEQAKELFAQFTDAVLSEEGHVARYLPELSLRRVKAASAQ